MFWQHRCAMAPIDLNLVRAFVAVHESGSFSAAGERLEVPRSTVSRAVAALEQSLDVLLFHRTTRRVTTTAAGLALHERLSPSLLALEASLSDLPERKDEPTGTLRLTTTTELGSTVVAEAIARFTALHPKVDVDLHLDNRVVDLARGGFDLALRVSSGPLRVSSLIARKLGNLSLQLYSSPAYLAGRGMPRSASDLASHDLIGLRGAPPMPLAARSKSQVRRSRIDCDDMLVARALIRAGGGTGMLFSFLADGDVTEGRLVRVLPNWLAQAGAVFLVYPSRRHVPHKVTAFRDLVLEVLRHHPLPTL
jgi:DNA-binding transcriptional LysR family regulator